MKITKKFLMDLLKMSNEEKTKKAVETGDFTYCLDAKKCLKEIYNIDMK